MTFRKGWATEGAKDKCPKAYFDLNWGNGFLSLLLLHCVFIVLLQPKKQMMVVIKL